MRKWYSKLRESENYNVIILAVLAALVLKLIRFAYVGGVSIYHVIARDMVEDIELVMGRGIIISAVCIVLAIAFVIQACKGDPNFMICAIVAMTVVAVAGVSLCAVQCIIACGYWLWMVKTSSDKSEFARIRRLTIVMIGVSLATFLVWELGTWIPFGFETLKDEVIFALRWAFGNCLNPEVFLVAYLYKCSHRRAFKNICRVLAVVWVIVVIGSLLTAMMAFAGLGRWSEWDPEEMPSNVDYHDEGDWSGWSTLDEDGNMVRMEEDENGNITYYDEEGNGATMQEFEFD